MALHPAGQNVFDTNRPTAELTGGETASYLPFGSFPSIVTTLKTLTAIPDPKLKGSQPWPLGYSS